MSKAKEYVPEMLAQTAKHRPCFHGGTFFKDIGERFESIQRREDIINADVLDAWFPPAPAVIRALQEDISWLLKTSPPTNCDGLIEEIAEVRRVPAVSLTPGAGSSDLIFRVLREWLRSESRVLILDPTYGEYVHVLEQVVGCTVDRFQLYPKNNWQVDLESFAERIQHGYDLVILVNPNSPTGRHIPRVWLEPVLKEAPSQTRIWIDETYVDYAGAGESLERFAASSPNVFVCKSMSKVYALSGARVAYLCGPADEIKSIRGITPPWVVSLPAQLAAVRALQSTGYYIMQWDETHLLRQELAEAVEGLDWKVYPGIANFLLCQIPRAMGTSEQIIGYCRTKGVHLRNPVLMGTSLQDNYVRIAVKDRVGNQRILQVLSECHHIRA